MSITVNSRRAWRLAVAVLCAAGAITAHAQGSSEASEVPGTQHATPAVAASSGADRALAANVRHALKAARKQGLKSSFIRVRAHDGVVTLSGVVANEKQIEMATTVAQGVNGVHSVNASKLIIRDDEGLKGSQ